MNTTLEKLAALQNRGTLYELELANVKTGERRLIAYTRKTKTKGLNAIARRGAAVVAVIDHKDVFVAARTEKRFIATTPDGEWIARFTGRTQREAITGGELKPIA